MGTSGLVAVNLEFPPPIRLYIIVIGKLDTKNMGVAVENSFLSYLGAEI